MTVLVIIGITLLVTLGISTLLLLKQEINYKIANEDNFRLELCLDYLEYYKNELKKYQK